MADVGTYLKKHTEALVKDVGIEAACQITGKSKATLGRYYSDNPEHADRFMPVDAVAKLESAASFPHVTSGLADLKNITLSQRFATLMSEYQEAMADGIITINEAKRLLRETVMLQQVLLDMKLHLEEESG